VQQQAHQVQLDRARSDEISPAPYKAARIEADGQATWVQHHRMNQEWEGLGNGSSWEDEGGTCGITCKNLALQPREGRVVSSAGRPHRSVGETFDGQHGCPTTAEILAIIREGSQLSNDLVAGQLGLISASLMTSAAALARMDPSGGNSSSAAAVQGGRLAIAPGQVLNVPRLQKLSDGPVRDMYRGSLNLQGLEASEQHQPYLQQQQQREKASHTISRARCSDRVDHGVEPTSPLSQARKQKGAVPIFLTVSHLIIHTRVIQASFSFMLFCAQS
jgi:hypothetical protein